MGEKKATNISLSTFLLIIAIIIIIVMGGAIYKLYNDKKAETKRAEELQTKTNELTTQVNSQKEDISELQGKIDKVSETVRSNISNTNNSSKETTLSESEALTILKSKFDIIEKIYLSPDKYFKVTAGDEIKDFDTTILKYGTDNWLKEVKNNLPMCVRLENGKYYFLEGGGAREYVGFDKFENIKVTNSTITATLKTKQSTFNGNDWVSANDKSSEFILVKNGNEWLIDKMNSSDLN